MISLCLTAGIELPDVLWAATVLPALRRAAPETELIWECPDAGIRRWLAGYPELDAVYGDVETAAVAPDVYLILHPWWSSHTDATLAPVDVVQSLVSQWCGPSATFPAAPYCPNSLASSLTRPDLPSGYLCLDPDGDPPLDAEIVGEWLERFALPVAQVGSTQRSVWPGLIDARSEEISATARVIGHARLFIGGDSASSCLAQALNRPQIWFARGDSNWIWPRGKPPLCSTHVLDPGMPLDSAVLADLARRAPTEDGR